MAIYGGREKGWPVNNIFWVGKSNTGCGDWGWGIDWRKNWRKNFCCIVNIMVLEVEEESKGFWDIVDDWVGVLSVGEIEIISEARSLREEREWFWS